MIRIRRPTQGFTLVELMISLVIGATITGTGLTLFLQMSKSRSVIQAEVALQENSYYVAQTLKQLLNQAGYRPLSADLFAGPLMPIKSAEDSFVEVNGNWKQGEFVRAQDNGLAIRFDGSSNASGVADGSIINCQGEPIAEGEISDIAFVVVDGALLCTSGVEVTELIVESDGVLIEQLAVLWGIDTNNDKNVDEYRAAADVSTSESLLAVRVQMLLSSRDEVMKGSFGYTFNGVEYAAIDSRLRREMTTTVQIKN